MVEAYKSYLPMPYDRPTWDLTSVLYAIEGPSYFTVSPAGNITVSDKGETSFVANPVGNHHYLMTDSVQGDVITKRFVDLITQKPANK